jgi:hypothetical protein
MDPNQRDYRIFRAGRKARARLYLAASTARGILSYVDCSAGSFGALCGGAPSDQALFGHGSP